MFYNTLKLNHIILYHIWYLQNDKLPFYIYSIILPVLTQNAALNIITTKREYTVLQYSTALSSGITSFCNIFDICYMMNLPFYIYSRILQVLFQHAALNLIDTRREFTLFQYSKTLSSLITSFCIIFDICKMINYRFIYIFQNTPSIDFKMLYWI